MIPVPLLNYAECFTATAASFPRTVAMTTNIFLYFCFVPLERPHRLAQGATPGMGLL